MTELAGWTIRWDLSVGGDIHVTVEGPMPGWDTEPDAWGQQRAIRQVVEKRDAAVIGQEVLFEAAQGHSKRLETSEKIQQALIDLDISPDEVAAVIKALVGIRDDGSTVGFDRVAYAAAVLDGFVLAARAARLAQGAL